MKRLLFAALAFATAAHADDRTRDVQAELKKQGFYYGEVNGSSSEELNAAVRRYQIRNGLKVTGQLNDETLGAMGLEAAAPAPAKPAPELEKPAPKPEPMREPQVNPPAPGEGGMRQKAERPTERPIERYEPEPEPAERPLRGVPVDPSSIEPPRAMPSATYDQMGTLFHGTPYATAPREVQEDTLANAQRLLQRERLYRGEVDGYTGVLTSEALFLYQEKYALRRTGRLDLETLGKMRLLPRVAPSPLSPRPFYNPNQRRDSTVLRGVWVR